MRHIPRAGDSVWIRRKRGGFEAVFLIVGNSPDQRYQKQDITLLDGYYQRHMAWHDADAAPRA